MNSRRKGKVGELEFAALLRANGFDARRGQQFAGGPESPDVVSEALSWLHVEVKRVQNLNLVAACLQAERDSSGRPWVVAHRRNHEPWLITMSAETLFDFLRGVLPPHAGEREDRAGVRWHRFAVDFLRVNAWLWAVTIEAKTFFYFLRGYPAPQAFPSPTQAPLPSLGSGALQAGAATVKISARDACPGHQPKQQGNEKETYEQYGSAMQRER